MKEKEKEDIIKMSEGWSSRKAFGGILINNRILERLVALFCLIVGIYALLLCVRTGYFEGVKIRHALSYLVPMAIVLVFVLDLRAKYKWLLLSILLFVSGYYVYVNFEVFKQIGLGVAQLVGKWIAWYLADATISIPVDINLVSKKYMDECAVLFCVPWTILSSIAWSNRKRGFFSIVALVLYLVIFFCGGYMPDFIPIMLLIASVVGVCFKKPYNMKGKNSNGRIYIKNVRGQIAYIVVLAVSYFAYGSYLKPVSNVILPVQDFVYNGYSLQKVDVGEGNGDDAHGGISGGKTGKGGISFSPKGTTVFNVFFNEDTKGDVYLKAFVADSYDGEGWINEYNPLDYMYGLSSTPYDVISSEYYFLKLALASQLIVSDYGDNNADYSGFSNAEGNMVTIRSRSPELYDNGFVLLPYLSYVTDRDGTIADGYYLRQNTVSGHASYFDYYQYEGGFGTDSAFFKDYEDYLKTNPEVSSNREKYIEAKYAYECCLGVPDFLSEIKDKYKDKAKDNIAATIDYVKKELTDGFVYTTNPKKTPGNKDFISYFLFESKEGYCMYYASAATMIFRSMGIPARYVEGYLVPKSEAKVAKTVKDSNAHAWTEIYLDNFGWIPVEVTNANFTGTGFEATSTSAETRETKESQTKKPTQSSETKPTQQTTTKATTVSSDGDESKKADNPLADIAIWVIGACLLIVMVIALYLGGYYLFYALPLKKSVRMPYKQRLLKTYKRIYRLTKRQKAFVAEGDGKEIAIYWELKQAEVLSVCESLMAAEYGKREITLEECLLIEKIEEKLLMRKNKKAKGIGKLITLRKLRIRRKIYAGK